MLASSPRGSKDLSRAVGIDFLGLTTGDENFGIAVLSIAEILRVPRITAVPRAHESIAGVASVRGSLVTIFDLKRLVELPGPSVLSSTSRVLIIERPHERVGLLVEGVTEVFRTDSAMLEAPSVIGGEPPPHVLAVARPKFGVFVLLDERFLFERSL